MLIRLTGVDLLGLHNALNEVAHGLSDEDVQTELRERSDEIDGLLQRIGVIGLREQIAETVERPRGRRRNPRPLAALS